MGATQRTRSLGWAHMEQICPPAPTKDDISGADESSPAETRLNKGSSCSMGRRDCLTLRNWAQTRFEMFCWTPAPPSPPRGRQQQPAAWAMLCSGSQAGAESRPQWRLRWRRTSVVFVGFSFYLFLLCGVFALHFCALPWGQGSVYSAPVVTRKIVRKHAGESLALN